MRYIYHRHMRTTAERRRNALDAVDDENVAVKYRCRTLRNYYDDVNRQMHRCWKSYRRTRWKA